MYWTVKTTLVYTKANFFFSQQPENILWTQQEKSALYVCFAISLKNLNSSITSVAPPPAYSGFCLISWYAPENENRMYFSFGNLQQVMKDMR